MSKIACDRECDMEHCSAMHRLHIRQRGVEVTVIRGGQRTYLHVEMDTRAGYISGVVTLRRLARALLAEASET